MSLFVLVLMVALSGCQAEPPKERPKVLLPENQALLAGKALVHELKKGGYVLYFRHFHTDHTRWHEDPIKPKHGEMAVKHFLASCDRQRPLTDFGRRRTA